MSFATTRSGVEKTFYVSTAYNPNQVFVSTMNPFDKPLYLRNLIVDVSVVHEPYSFSDVEI